MQLLKRYDNYVEAHLDKNKLENENIHCVLRDVNTVSLYPLFSNAIGGIKLYVADD